MARVRIGSAEIDLTLLTGKFTSGVERVKSGVAGMRDRFSSMRAELNTTSGQLRAFAAVAGAGYAAKAVFELGSAVEETASKFSTVFGPATQDVQSFIDNFGTLAGLSNEQAQAVISTTGSIVQGMGFAQQASAAFAVEVTKLAGDLSSFNNIPIEETSLAIQAALTGEREQLKRLGIVLREVDVQQRALALSGKDSARELTNQEKATATLQLITERAGVAVGDLERTQDSAANRARALTAELQNMKERIASALLPVIGFLVDKFANMIDWIEAAGAQAAVFMGQIDLLVARMKFWDKEGIQAATENLGFLKEAAAEVMDGIAGLTTSTSALADSTQNMATIMSAAATPSIRRASERSMELKNNFVFLGDAAIAVATNLTMVGQAAGFAANEQERLNRATSQFNAIASAASFLTAAIPGLGFLAKPLGLITGAVSAGSGLKGSFGNQTNSSFASDPTITIRVQGVSDQTVQTIRGKMRDFVNLDVPVVV